MDGWIELVFGMEASFDLSYKKFKYLQNNGTSLWNFVPNSHTHFAMARVVNLARQRLTLSVKNWTVFGHCKLTILATASLSQRVCAWGSGSRGSICDSWYLLDRPPVYMMSDRHAALLLATVHLAQLVSATASTSCSEYRTTQLGSFSKHQDDTTLARCWGRYTGCPFNRGSSRK